MPLMSIWPSMRSKALRFRDATRLFRTSTRRSLPNHPPCTATTCGLFMQTQIAGDHPSDLRKRPYTWLGLKDPQRGSPPNEPLSSSIHQREQHLPQPMPGRPQPSPSTRQSLPTSSDHRNMNLPTPRGLPVTSSRRAPSET